MNYPQLFARIFNQPQLIEPMQAEIMMGALQGRFGINVLVNHEGLEQTAADIQKRAVDYEGRYDHGPFRTTTDGIAVITTSGTLVNRGGIYPSSGITSFSGLRQRFRAAAANDEVRGILHIVDSPGGQVSGCDDTSLLIHEIAKEKPVWTQAYDQMTSAAYWKGAAGNRIIATKTARIGSVGVLVMHADYSKHIKKEGIEVTFIHAGAQKVMGNCYEPLPTDMRDRIQAEVDGIYEEFTSRVAEYRGIDQQKVKDTEAGVFNSADALDLGLIDAISPADDVLAEFSEHLSGAGRVISIATTGANAMTIETKPKANTPAASTDANTPAADQGANNTPAPAPAQPSAADERARISAIIGSEEAKGREQLAQHFAFETDMHAEAVVAALKVSPKAQAEPSKPQGSSLDRAMANADQPEISADGGEGASAEDQQVNELCAAYNR
ncbi:S49 family peptidase [Endozoicomonas lisbonensis]|uniref:S49 family peptidase n=1 Tax=Endozoicomonas lisbonensis TaxID=3120522 RepID=UPI003395BCCD